MEKTLKEQVKNETQTIRVKINTLKSDFKSNRYEIKDQKQRVEMIDKSGDEKVKELFSEVLKLEK